MNKKQIVTAVATFAVLGSSFVGAASADWELSIHGNGSRSDNSIDVDVNKDMNINQSSNTDISNDVSVVNNTGFNSASGNTGGDVSINTGDADANVMIHNMAGSNIAEIDSCGGCDEDFEVSISGNGSRSDNEIDLNFDKSFNVDQDNDTDIDNNVDVVNNTGFNSADDNTSGYGQNFDYDYDKDEKKRDHYDWNKNWDKNSMSKYQDWLDEYMKKMYFLRYGGSSDGNVSIDTGDANADVMVHNMASSNWLSL